jgi:hypothetical protein
LANTPVGSVVLTPIGVGVCSVAAVSRNAPRTIIEQAPTPITHSRTLDVRWFGWSLVTGHLLGPRPIEQSTPKMTHEFSLFGALW